MLLSRDKSIVIATPTKTGTVTLITALCRGDQFKYILPKHGIDYPDVCARRIMPIRNPYDRLRSMYLWAIKKGGVSGSNFASKACRDDNGGNWCSFSKFLEFHATISHRTWGWPYHRIARHFGANEIWRLENFSEHLLEFATPDWRRSRNGEVLIPHSNTSKMRKENAEFSARDLEVVRPFVEEDCLTYGYPLRLPSIQTELRQVQ